jgi:hypothetical protein
VDFSLYPLMLLTLVNEGAVARDLVDHSARVT